MGRESGVTNSPVIASGAKQSRDAGKSWIASSLALLAMTVIQLHCMKLSALRQYSP
jgi:hypothetical protein